MWQFLILKGKVMMWGWGEPLLPAELSSARQVLLCALLQWLPLPRSQNSTLCSVWSGQELEWKERTSNLTLPNTKLHGWKVATKWRDLWGFQTKVKVIQCWWSIQRVSWIPSQQAGLGRHYPVGLGMALPKILGLASLWDCASAAV